MEPATPFVSTFVGETNRFAGEDGTLHIRPHELEIVEQGGQPLRVENVFRKGGCWRVEGRIAGNDHIIEMDVDAHLPAPLLGSVVNVRPTRSKLFADSGQAR